MSLTSRFRTYQLFFLLLSFLLRSLWLRLYMYHHPFPHVPMQLTFITIMFPLLNVLRLYCCGPTPTPTRTLSLTPTSSRRVSVETAAHTEPVATSVLIWNIKTGCGRCFTHSHEQATNGRLQAPRPALETTSSACPVHYTLTRARFVARRCVVGLHSGG